MPDINDRVIGNEIVCAECLSCKHRTWFQRSEYGLTSEALLRRRMRCTQCASTAVRLQRPQFIDPEQLTYVLFLQSLPTAKAQVIGRIANINVAKGAFEAACREHQRRRIYLAQGLRIIFDSQNQPPGAAE